MDKNQEHLEAIRDIRTLMERSSRFLPLSGLSGMLIGVWALGCTAIAYSILGIAIKDPGYHTLLMENGQLNSSSFPLLMADFMLALLAALSTGLLMAMRKAKKMKLPVWDATAKRMLANLAIPLVAGGIYCLILLYLGEIVLIAPATLLFYGLALVNASKYTIAELRFLGILEIATGLMATLFADYGLLFWATGFGILHIVYGILIYNKYEK
ncbi:MAG TPA: hypothetical protein VJ552_14180 [Sediminibacterium sp.]|nr:hypothetical protein [Sediminibacterium sp.]